MMRAENGKHLEWPYGNIIMCAPFRLCTEADTYIIGANNTETLYFAQLYPRNDNIQFP